MLARTKQEIVANKRRFLLMYDRKLMGRWWEGIVPLNGREAITDKGHHINEVSLHK